MIEIKNLCKTYSEFSLQNVSFTVPDGYVTGFIGPNGAGKDHHHQIYFRYGTARSWQY